MEITELETIESDEGVRLSYKPKTKTLSFKGKKSAIDRVIERIAAHRDEVATLLCRRQGIPEERDEEEVVEREIAVNVPSLEVQKANYVAWFSMHTKFYWPSESELDKMFSVLQPSDLVLPDFAMSFSVRKANGLIVQVNRKGEISAPSPYSPAVLKS